VQREFDAELIVAAAGPSALRQRNHGIGPPQNNTLSFRFPNRATSALDRKRQFAICETGRSSDTPAIYLCEGATAPRSPVD
jgi:hypothetical protein